MFQGNIMPDPSDEWIYKDTELVLLKEVIAPALRLAIKLQFEEHKVIILEKNSYILWCAIRTITYVFLIGSVPL